MRSQENLVVQGHLCGSCQSVRQGDNWSRTFYDGAPNPALLSQWLGSCHLHRFCYALNVRRKRGSREEKEVGREALEALRAFPLLLFLFSGSWEWREQRTPLQPPRQRRMRSARLVAGRAHVLPLPDPSLTSTFHRLCHIAFRQSRCEAMCETK